MFKNYYKNLLDGIFFYFGKIRVIVYVIIDLIIREER